MGARRPHRRSLCEPLRAIWNDFQRALSLLTILPAYPDWDAAVPLGRAMAFYPLIGLGIGGLLVGWASLLGWAMSGPAFAPLRSALILALWVVLTGGLHLDGWGDACDALLSSGDAARRLAILRDPRMGSFGVIGIALILMAKWAALQAEAGRSPLVLSPVLARWAVVWAAAGWPAARPGGMGDRFRRGLRRRHLLIASLIALAVASGMGISGGIAALAALLTAGGVARFAHGRLGGLTGDIYGAIIEGVELIVLLALALQRG